MSWLTKLLIIGILCALQANAERLYFNSHSKTRLQTRLLLTRDMVAPIDIELSIPYLDIEKNQDGFDEVLVNGLAPLDISGNPDLYTTGALIAVPNGFEPEVEILSKDTRELKNVVVKPSQKKFRCASPHNESFAFHSDLYRSNEVYPKEVVALEEVGRLQGVRLVRVGINPLQMNMGNNSLSVTSEITVRVMFKEVGERKATLLSKTFYQLVRTIAANGMGINDSVVEAGGPETMLVFVADALKDGLMPLLEWKRAKGLHVEVITLTEAGGTNEKVKEYIQNYHDTHATKPTYLLFVGNGTTMPPLFESTSAGQAASDYRFSLLSGADAIPDALYGRIVANDLNELTTQVGRWIEYEKTPEAGGLWYKSLMTIASNEGANPSDKEYAEQVQTALKAHTYTGFDQFYQGTQTATAKNILAAAKEGRSWIAYFGHGSGTSWGSTNDTFDVAAVGQLQNGDRLPILIDVACLNASYVSIPTCFGKAWVTKQDEGRNAGAVAFYGGSVSISWHPPAVMSVGIAKYHFEKPVYTLGGSVLAGQLYLIEKMGNTTATIDNLEWYNLFGDPSLLVRTDTPKPYTIKTNIAEEAQRVIVTVKAVDSSGYGIAALLASLKSKTGISPLAVASTDQEGLAVLEVSGQGQLEPNTMLTVTGYNVETYQAAVQ